MFKRGDTVRVLDSRKWTGVWNVVKVNKTTADLEQAGKKLRCHMDLMEKVDGKAKATVTGVPFQTRELPHCVAGSFVRFLGASGRGGLTKGRILTVLVDKFDKVNCTFVGGNNDRYWRLPHRTLEQVPTEVALKELTA